MIPFLVGFVLGVVVAGAVATAYLQQRTEALRQELGLIRARLRSVVHLASAGAIRPETIEGATLLNTLHDLLTREKTRR